MKNERGPSDVLFERSGEQAHCLIRPSPRFEGNVQKTLRAEAAMPKFYRALADKTGARFAERCAA